MKWWALLMMMATWLLASTAAAESVSELAKKLRTADDFRVRTQAALALGATGDEAAVSPLCGGLDDDSDTVRAAAAAGLGKLALGGKSCLKKRLGREGNKNVQKMIAKALRLLDEAASGPAISGSTRYYVSIAPLQNHTGRSSTDIVPVVRRAMMKAARRAGGFAFAPTGEPEAKAKKILRKHPQLVGYRIVPDVSTTRSGDQLSVACRLELQSYPDRQGLGNVGRSKGRSGIDPDDHALEDELVEEVCDESMAEFTKMAAEIN